MSKGKGQSQEKKREKFQKFHPDGRKAFAKEKRKRKLETRLQKLKKYKRVTETK